MLDLLLLVGGTFVETMKYLIGTERDLRKTLPPLSGPFLDDRVGGRRPDIGEAVLQVERHRVLVARRQDLEVVGARCFAERNIARTIHAVIESGSGVTSFRPLMSDSGFDGSFGFTISDTVYSV